MVGPRQLGGISGKYLSQRTSVFTDGLNIKVDGVSDQDCKLMAMSELSYVERIRGIQTKKYPDKADKRRKTRK